MLCLSTIREDIRAIFERDPAAKNVVEVCLTYPGFHAILWHRVVHILWTWKVPLLPRFISHLARFITGIEIHPGAVIGRGFFIDHGMGVVIGETAIVGDHVTLYQGVTLGGTGHETRRRHPTIGSHVIIGAGAKILGAITIGDHVRIGANSVVLQSVPDHTTVVGIPAQAIRRQREEDDLDHTQLPDLVAERMAHLEEQMRALKSELIQKLNKK